MNKHTLVTAEATAVTSPFARGAPPIWAFDPAHHLPFCLRPD